jgi:hypothetical protein
MRSIQCPHASSRVIVGLVACIALLAASCGSRREITPQSSLDTAAIHYGRGLIAFEEGDLQTAQAQFSQARGLDADFPGAYSGAALVMASQGDFFRARQSVEEALHRDASFVDAHISLGRIVMDEGLSKGRGTSAWLQEAMRSFERASRLAPDGADADFYMAQAQAQGGEVAAALTSYQRVIARNRGPLVSRAMAMARRLQIIQRAAPGTKMGARIAVQEEVSQAELAVLLLEEMKLEELITQRRTPHGPSPFRPPTRTVDASRTEPQSPTASLSARQKMGLAWALPWVQRALELGIPGFEVLPDGSLATGSVSRAQFAQVVQGILSLLSAADDLTTSYIGQPSRFADVSGDHFSYNAIALSVDRGIMHPEPVSGRFRPDDPVTGADALLIVRKLQNAVRMEY